MDLGLANSVAVVTGGSSGIGLATARLLLIAEGARVAICGRNVDRLSAARTQLEAMKPGAVLAECCDALDRDAVDAFARNKHMPLGRLGTPDEPAHAIVFLGSPAASYITGAGFEVSGGVSRFI